MLKKITFFERKVMGITWMHRKTNEAILHDLDTKENLLINNIIRQKLTLATYNENKA
jgi:hypothetical protein